MDIKNPTVKALLSRWKKYLDKNTPLNILVEDWALAIYEEDHVNGMGDFVRLETIHSAKGKEYKKVFLAGVMDGILPDHDGLLEEERRLFYVGITRAKRELTISYPLKRYGKEIPVSPFIEEIRHCPCVILSKTEEKPKRKKGKNM